MTVSLWIIFPYFLAIPPFLQYTELIWDVLFPFFQPFICDSPRFFGVFTRCIMKYFDWSIVLCILGADVLLLGVCLNWPLFIPALITAALFVLLAFRSHAQRKQLHSEHERCAELIRQLETEQAKHEQAMAELTASHEQSRSTFFSEISHSLRMPISVIQGYAELMQKGAVDPVRESEYLDRILHHTRRMIDVLSQKLDSVSEEPPAPNTAKRVDLIPMIKNQLQDLQSTATARGVTLQLVCSEDTLSVCADKRLLQRILYNLIENSMKYMGREGIVTVLLSHDETEARISVRDDGMGLPESEVARIFEAHFRGSNSSPVAGNGYGLFLVKQAVEAQGGSVRASSHPGRGMSITFTLPLAAEGTSEAVV